MIIYDLIVFLFTSIITLGHSARILAVFPVPSISHQVVFRPLTQELAKRGHEVIVITPDPAFETGKSPPNLTEIDVHELSYKAWQEGFFKHNTGILDAYTQMNVIFSLFNSIFELQLQSAEVSKLLNSEQEFDLLLVEACARSSIAMSHRYKVPMIQISSFGSMVDSYSIMGYPSHPLLYPHPAAKNINNRSFIEKIEEIFMFIKYSYMFSRIENEENDVIQRNFGPNAPTMAQLRNNVDMLFINAHSIRESNRPIPPTVVNIGGIHKQKEKELAKDIKTYLDSSQKGVIYVSFGTNIDPSLMPPEKIKILLNVFSKVPYDVLWKWPLDELPGKTDNIKIQKWLPQSDLLRHKKVKLFITQGGLQSTDEAIEGGVPMIGMPMMADQWFNVEQSVKQGIAIKIDFPTINEDQLKHAIDRIMKDDSYYKNIKKVKSIVQDLPKPPLENAVWWTEYVLRHGGAKHLRCPSANMSIFEYYELQLVFILLFIIVICLIIIKLLLHSLKLKKKIKQN